MNNIKPIKDKSEQVNEKILTKIQNYIINFINKHETQIKEKINDLHKQQQEEHRERLIQYQNIISKIKKQINERQTSQQPCDQVLQQNLKAYQNSLQLEINNENKINTTINVPTRFLNQTDCEKLDSSILYLECENTKCDSQEHFDKTINCLKNITTSINGEIAKLKANEKKKIYINIGDKLHNM